VTHALAAGIPPAPDYGAAAPPGQATHAPAHAAQFSFTGVGAEYFRIWVVNLLLTIVTLGVYSAWAKVRKTRYFLQNTRLDGHAFDFHGNPKAILIGRIVALLLIAGYSSAFKLSPTAGLVMLVVLCVVGPWLFMRAQRFRFGNTSWRGLRFGFDGDAAEAYRIVLPLLLIWFSGTIVSVAPGPLSHLAGLLGFAVLGLWPWMHHRLKGWQHTRARYGDRAFAFAPAIGAFYGFYVVAWLVVTAAAAVVTFALVGSLIRSFSTGTWLLTGVFVLLVAAGIGFGVFLLVWPYFHARLQATVWSHTSIGPVRFRTEIAAWPLARLVAANMLLTLATAGLYWPFAAVALARYRIECMRAESAQPLGAFIAGTTAGGDGATGDAAAEAFGLDIGL
jgi:uncharacterized membrane protein YjgN (DUF898 family)